MLPEDALDRGRPLPPAFSKSSNRPLSCAIAGSPAQNSTAQAWRWLGRLEVHLDLDDALQCPYRWPTFERFTNELNREQDWLFPFSPGWRPRTGGSNSPCVLGQRAADVTYH